MSVQPFRDLKKIARMKDILKKENARNYALFVVGIHVGLRISDLLSLKWNDTMGSGGVFKRRVTITEGKTEKTRDFFLQDEATKALKEYRNTLEMSTGDHYIFKSRKGLNRPIDRFQAHNIINDIASRVGIKEAVGTHSLRKTFGYHAYKTGVDIVLLMDVFNHSTPAMTKKYIGITDDDIKNVYFNLKL